MDGDSIGTDIAKILHKEGVDLVVSEKFGANMTDALNENGIQQKKVTHRTVKNAIGGFLK